MVERRTVGFSGGKLGRKWVQRTVDRERGVAGGSQEWSVVSRLLTELVLCPSAQKCGHQGSLCDIRSELLVRFWNSVGRQNWRAVD